MVAKGGEEKREMRGGKRKEEEGRRESEEEAHKGKDVEVAQEGGGLLNTRQFTKDGKIKLKK